MPDGTPEGNITAGSQKPLLISLKLLEKIDKLSISKVRWYNKEKADENHEPMPILGPDSNAKARDIWCSKEPSKAWRSWMLDGQAPTRNMGGCDAAALDRNVEFGHKYRVNGTPGLFFEDGTRKPGALPLDQVEKLLVAAASGGAAKKN